MKTLIFAAAIAAVNVWMGYPFPMWLALVPFVFKLFKPLLIIFGCVILLIGALAVSAIYGEGNVGKTLNAMKEGFAEELHAIKKGK